ncbi:MAG: relaxase/mobilization nuclease domain-containing protein [Bacteroidetes bacterium]|nr:relaxase/mobilization nuclease domain-containing protein [Bacteroidota bacterium]
MTGNQIKGKGFRGALRYNLEKVNNKVAEVLDHSFARVSEGSIMKEVQLVRVQRPNLQRYFYHTSINFPPSEDLANDLMTRLGHDYLQANGFTQHQFIMFRHRDAEHPHLHILVNRIGYDGSVLSDSNDYARSEGILRELEKKYQLTQVASSRQAHERAPTKNELEMMKRTNAPSVKLKLQIIIKSVLKKRSGMTTDQFINALEPRGVQVLFNQAKTGYVSGISYRLGDFVITGSKLGNDFKWKSITKHINYEQARDHSAICAANARTKQRAVSEKSGSPLRGDRSVDKAGQHDFEQLRHANDTQLMQLHGSRTQAAAGNRPATQNRTDRSEDRNQEPKNKLAFAKIFDGYPDRNLRDADYESYLATDSLGRPRKKKKRRGRRI